MASEELFRAPGSCAGECSSFGGKIELGSEFDRVQSRGFLGRRWCCYALDFWVSCDTLDGLQLSRPEGEVLINTASL